MRYKLGIVGLGLSWLLALPSPALVEPEVEAWQTMVAAATEVCELPGSDILAEALGELGALGSAAMSAPMAPLMEELEQRRGLAFRYFTPWHVKSREQLRSWLNHQLQVEFPAAKVAKEEALLKALGLVERDFRVLPFLEDLLTSQVGGIYDPERDQFFLVDLESGRSLSDRARDSLLTSAGLGSSDQSSVIIIHELDHALGGQHFDLRGLLAQARDWSLDRQMAAQALIEGDATFVMIDYQNRRPAAEAGAQTFVQGADMMSKLVQGMAVMPIPIPGLGEFGEAPLYFQGTLLFPYFYGAELVTTLRHSGADWAAVNAAYRLLPRTTRQVLHPEDYLYSALLPEPTTPDLRALPERLDDWQKAVEETGGEFVLRLFLEQHGVPQASLAAQGWLGDRIRVYRRADGELAFVWAIAWEGPEERQEFERSVRGLAYSVEALGAQRSLLFGGFEASARAGLRQRLAEASGGESTPGG